MFLDQPLRGPCQWRNVFGPGTWSNISRKVKKCKGILLFLLCLVPKTAQLFSPCLQCENKTEQCFFSTETEQEETQSNPLFTNPGQMKMRDVNVQDHILLRNLFCEAFFYLRIFAGHSPLFGWLDGWLVGWWAGSGCSYLSPMSSTLLYLSSHTLSAFLDLQILLMQWINLCDLTALPSQYSLMFWLSLTNANTVLTPLMDQPWPPGMENGNFVFVFVFWRQNSQFWPWRGLKCDQKGPNKYLWQYVRIFEYICQTLLQLKLLTSLLLPNFRNSFSET